MRRLPVLLVLPLLIAGCGDAKPTPRPVVAGPDDVVLRARTVGGVGGIGGQDTLPDVSVYGGGRVIARDADWATEYRLTPAAYDRLVREAWRAGLATPRTIEPSGVADAFSTVLTFVPDRRPRTTMVIKIPGEGGAPAAFAARLDPKNWRAGDLAAGPTPYRPVRLVTLAYEAPDVEVASPWPFGALGSGEQVAGRTCLPIDSQRTIDRARSVAGRHEWTYGGLGYRVSFRPLLPDEKGCAGLVR
jgi:hypothetical protein